MPRRIKQKLNTKNKQNRKKVSAKQKIFLPVKIKINKDAKKDAEILRGDEPRELPIEKKNAIYHINEEQQVKEILKARRDEIFSAARLQKNSNGETLERDKKMIMYSGVAFFTLLIFILWLFNLKTVFNNSHNKLNGSEFKEQGLDETTKEFKAALNEIKKEFAEIKSFNAASSTQSAPAGEAPTMREIKKIKDDDKLGSEEIKILKERLESGQ